MLWWTLRQTRSENPDARAGAARELAHQNDARAREALIALCSDSCWWVREAAIRSLGQVASTGSLNRELFERALSDEMSQVRLAVLDVWKEAVDHCSPETILVLLRDEDSRLRGAAFWAFRSCLDSRVVAAIKKADEIVKAQRTETLVSIGKSKMAADAKARQRRSEPLSAREILELVNPQARSAILARHNLQGLTLADKIDVINGATTLAVQGGQQRSAAPHVRKHAAYDLFEVTDASTIRDVALGRVSSFECGGRRVVVSGELQQAAVEYAMRRKNQGNAQLWNMIERAR